MSSMPKWLFCLFRILQPLRRLLVVCLAVFVPNTLLRQRHPLQLRLPRTTLPTPTDHPPTSAPPRPPPHHFMNPNIPIFDYFNFRLTALYYKHYNSNQKNVHFTSINLLPHHHFHTLESKPRQT